MSALAAGVAAIPSRISTGDLRGHISVRPRVLDKVIREVAADAIGVPRDEVAVSVIERGVGLALSISTRLPIPDLADADAIRAEGSLIDRLRSLQRRLAEESARITGREIRRVSIKVTGANIPERKRVR